MRRFVALLLTLLVASLAFADDPIEIRSVALCSQVKGIASPTAVDPTNRFAADTAVIHAVVVFDRVPETGPVRGTWISIDAIDVPNYEIGATDIEIAAGGAATAHYSISRPTKGWPAGSYEFRLSAKGRSLATSKFVVGPGEGAGPVRVPRRGTVHRHAKGFAFWMPEGWTAKPQEDGTVQVVPPPQEGSAAPELYSMSVESAAGKGLSGSDDPQVVQYLDEQIKSLHDGQTRKGGAAAIATGLGPGVLLEWEGRGQDGGLVRARGFSCLCGDICVLLIGVGRAESVTQHEADLAALLATLTRGEPKAPLEERAPAAAADAGVRQKLDALAKAHVAGVLSDEEYASKRAEILAGGTAAPSLRRVVPGRSGHMYRHPIGFSMWYPDGWTVTPNEQALQLAPPDPETSPAGPVEAYFVAAESVAAAGISDPFDARLAAHFDGQMQTIAPFLRRQVEPRRVEAGDGKGALLEWEGDNPAGDRILARTRLVIVKGYAVALVSIGHKAPVDKREPQMRQVFASFRLGEGERDPELAGTWSFLTSHAMTNWSPFETAATRANMASDASATVTLRADGQYTRTSRRHMIAGAGGTWVESDDVKSDRGQWFGGNGRVVLLSDKQEWEEYEYRVERTAEGARLLLVRDGTGELWERARP